MPLLLPRLLSRDFSPSSLTAPEKGHAAGAVLTLSDKFPPDEDLRCNCSLLALLWSIFLRTSSLLLL